MNEKFKDIGADEDTKILLREEIKIHKIDAVHEKWIWDGIKGESVIFYNEDTTTFGESEIKQMVKSNLNVLGSLTFSKQGLYTFVNFNFKTD